ncbi:MAG: SH3 domain-containing protein [Chrysiogenales bacterium]
MIHKAIMFFFLAVLTTGWVFGVQQVKVTVAKANVRAEADPEAAVIGTASRDDVFTVLEKNGAWYKIALPAESASEPQFGFINEIVVAVVRADKEVKKQAIVKKTAEQVPEPEEKALPRKKIKVHAKQDWEPEEKLFSGLSLKFGLMTSPQGGNFGDKWIMGIAYDKGLNRYLSLGLEFQPYLRSYSSTSIPDASLSLIGAHVFINVKAGANIGQFVPFLKFWKPYFGLGFGGAFESRKIKYQALSDSVFKSYFAWHWMLGSEFVLKSMDLILEYQAIKVSVPSVDPDFFTHFLMLGVRF